MIKIDGLSSALMNAAADAIIVIDGKGTIRKFSPSAALLFGYSPDECLGRNVSMLMPPRYARDHDGHLSRYFETREPHVIGIGRDVEGQRKNGSRFPMHLSVGETSIDGESMFVGICHDLTAYRDAVHQLSVAEQRYRDIIQHQSELVCRLDQNLNVTFANPSFGQVLGVSHNDVVGTPIDRLVAGDGDTFRQLLISLFKSHEEIEQITLKISMKGSEESVLVDWTFRRLPTSEAYGLEIQGLGVDVSERDAAIDRANFLLNHDHLTGFLNKKGFIEALKELQGDGNRYALIHLDCENFGLINHRFGFEAGDSIIQQASSRIESLIDESVIVCKAGGDDFLLLLRVENDTDVVRFVEKLSKVMSPGFVIGETSSLNLQPFIGIALCPEDTTTIERLPEMAEAAMLSCQKHQRSYSYFDETYHAELRRKLDLEQGLRAAIAEDQLTLYLQPKYELRNRNIVGYEALLRWHNTLLGDVSPGEFIPVAEQTVLGQHLDRYVIVKVLELISQHLPPSLRDFDSAEQHMHIAINITAKHLSDPSLADFIAENLRRYRVDPREICLEVTEGVLMTPGENVSENLSRLRALGVEVAIDDFGTGYSSLSYLKSIPADELKIDKSFVDDIETHSGATLIRAILSVAKAFHLRVIAEGIETEAQLKLLREMGCDCGQGYLLGRPAPAEKMLNAIRPFETTKV